jgi:hypothetical protein
VEARAALEEAEEFHRTPEELGERSGYGRCEEARRSTFAPLPPSGPHAQLPVVRVQLAHLDSFGEFQQVLGVPLQVQSWFAEEGGVKQATRLSGGVSLAPRKGSCMFAC